MTIKNLKRHHWQSYEDNRKQRTHKERVLCNSTLLKSTMTFHMSWSNNEIMNETEDTVIANMGT